MNNITIKDHSEQDNLELFNVVDGEIDLTKMENMSKDEKEMVKGILENIREVEKY